MLEPARKAKSVIIFEQFRKKYDWLTEEYFEDVDPRKFDRFWIESVFHNSPVVLQKYDREKQKEQIFLGDAEKREGIKVTI